MIGHQATYFVAELKAIIAVVALGVALDLFESWSRAGDGGESEDKTNDELHVVDEGGCYGCVGESG